MFFTRLISGVVLVLAAIALFFFGGIGLAAALGVLALVGAFELLRVFGLEKHPLGIVTYVGIAGYYILMSCLNYEFEMWSAGIIILLFLALLLVYVIKYPAYHINEVTKCLFTFFYLAVMLGYIYKVRCCEAGQWLVWLILISSWGSDTCAYLTGKLIGKHHFSELSPKKTVEGCVGGIVGAAVIAAVFACFFPNTAPGPGAGELFHVNPMILFPVVAALCALISQLGDLAASAIKRNYDKKDYGTVIPGHGGVLDRFDSVIFVAPVIYYLLVAFMFAGFYG